MCFLSTIQSAIFTSFIDRDLEIWYLHSFVEIGSFIYAVSYHLSSYCLCFSYLVFNEKIYIKKIQVEYGMTSQYLLLTDRELALRCHFLFKHGAFHKEVLSSLQCSILCAQLLQPL